MTTAYQNILVINLMHIGDLMLVTPVLRTLRANYPKARLTLLADKKLRDLVEYNPHLDACLLLDKKGEDNHPLAFLRFIQKVRKEKFDLVINLHRNERASALAAFSGARTIVGYAKPLFSAFFTKVYPNKKAEMHQIHSHYEVLERYGLIDHIEDKGLELTLPPKAKDKAAALWQEHFSTGQKVIALNIGASWPTKRWLDSYFAEVADHYIDKGYGIAFFGGAMDTELVHACISQMKHKDSPHVKIFTGLLTLGELAAMLELCVLMITTDSGPMHVAVARHVPVVTMFGASPVPGFYPYDSRDILLKTPVSCHPCGKHHCPLEGERYFECMKTMTPEMVIKLSDRLLKTYEGQAGKLGAPSSFQCQIVEVKDV